MTTISQASTHPGTRINAFVLKILAILGMTSNHVAHVFGDMLPWPATLALYSFGGITFPIMAFLLVEGYHYTSNLRRYATRLAVFAVIAQVPFTLCFGWGKYPIPTMNVLFTLLLGLGLLWIHGKAKNQGVSFFALLAAIFISVFCDWAVSGPILIYLFYILRGKGARGVLVAMLFLYAFVMVPNGINLVEFWQVGMGSAQNAIAQGIAADYDIYYICGAPVHFYNHLLQCLANLGYALVGFTIATICLCRYNGTRGRSMKWFFYAYYPLHLLAIWSMHEVLARLL